MSTEPNTSDPTTSNEGEIEQEEETRAPLGNASVAPLEDDWDLADVKLGERQGEACSMEEGCQSCQ